jgi:hypothetical protein
MNQIFEHRIRYMILIVAAFVSTLTIHAQTLQWERRYIEPDPRPNVSRLGYFGLYLTPASDGGLLVLARTGAGFESAVMKTDGQGMKLWEYKLGNPDTAVQAALLYETDDGEYETVGRMTWYGWLPMATYFFDRVTFTTSGTVTKRYGASGSAVIIGEGFSFIPSQNGGFADAENIVAGAKSGGMRLMYTKPNGELGWYSDFNEGDTLYYSRAVKQLDNGDYLIFGDRVKYGSFRRTFLLRTDSLGQKLWEKPLGSIDVGDRYGRTMTQTADGSVVTLSHYSTTDTVTKRLKAHLLLTKATTDGDVQWEHSYVTERESTYGWSVEQMHDGGFIIAGHTGNYNKGQSELDEATLEFYLLRTDSEGKTLWTKQWGVEGRGDMLQYARQLDDGSIVVTGNSVSDKTSEGVELYIAKLNEPPASVGNADSPNTTMEARLLPASNRIEVRCSLSASSLVRLSLVDMTGRDVIAPLSDEWCLGSHTHSIDVSRLPTGAYVVSLTANGRRESQIVIVTR